MKIQQLVPRISAQQLDARVRELAAQISHDYSGKEPLLVGVLKGAFIFLADLIRHMTIPVEIDFIRIASYGQSSESSGSTELKKDLEVSIEGKDVLVVEDIVDTGITLKWLMTNLKKRGPRSLKLCALIDKKERRQVDLNIDYVGIPVASGFLVGYGLDISEKYRYLDGIYEVVFENHG